MSDVLEVLNSVNRRQIAELEKTGRELDPSAHDAGKVFSERVRQVQAAILHTYQEVAYSAVRQADPRIAAESWQQMNALCDNPFRVLKYFKAPYPDLIPVVKTINRKTVRPRFNSFPLSFFRTNTKTKGVSFGPTTNGREKNRAEPGGGGGGLAGVTEKGGRGEAPRHKNGPRLWG